MRDFDENTTPHLPDTLRQRGLNPRKLRPLIALAFAHLPAAGPCLHRASLTSLLLSRGHQSNSALVVPVGRLSCVRHSCWSGISSRIKMSSRANAVSLELEPNPSPDASSTGPTFKRVYQACESCRQKKHKCSLGDPANPKPPCNACRRANVSCGKALHFEPPSSKTR